MPQFRVKVATHVDGSESYYPQYSYAWWPFWHGYEEGYGETTVVRPNLEQAKEYLRSEIASWRARTTVKTEVIKDCPQL